MSIVEGVKVVPMRPSRTWSVPNLLTYGRILAIPLLVVCFYLETSLACWLGFALFAMASITDFFDGYLARLWHQESAIGKMLDPIADKLLVCVAIVMLIWSGVIGYWSVPAAVIILVREISVSGLREFLADLRVSVPVSKLAKYKTAVQMVALAILLLAPVVDQFFVFELATYTGLGLLWAAALITMYTGYDYFRSGIAHIKEDG